MVKKIGERAETGRKEGREGGMISAAPVGGTCESDRRIFLAALISVTLTIVMSVTS